MRDNKEQRANPFTAHDVKAILVERGWLAREGDVARVFRPGEVSDAEAIDSWCAEAAALLGPHSASRAELEDLLSLVFTYDAAAIFAAPASHIVLAREHSREVIRALANLVLDAPALDSDRFKEIINALKDSLGVSSRVLFHPVRLALAGRAGEGAMDRVILLLDSAAQLPFAVRVKCARERMLEFCAALD